MAEVQLIRQVGDEHRCRPMREVDTRERDRARVESRRRRQRQARSVEKRMRRQDCVAEREPSTDMPRRHVVDVPAEALRDLLRLVGHPGKSEDFLQAHDVGLERGEGLSNQR